MLSGTLVISHDIAPNAETARALLAQCQTLPKQAFPLVICGFDRAACLELSQFLSDVCYNTYDYLACTAEVFSQTDTLPYLMTVGAGKVRHFSVQNSAASAGLHGKLERTLTKEHRHARQRDQHPHSSGRKRQLAAGKPNGRGAQTAVGQSACQPLC